MNSHCELMENDCLSSNECEVVCSPLCDHNEWERLTNNSVQMSQKIHSSIHTEVHDASTQKCYELQQPYLSVTHKVLSNPSDGDNLSVRSSFSNTSSCSNDRKVSCSNVKKSRNKLEEKLQLIAHYLETMSTGLGNVGQRTLRRKQRMDHARVYAHTKSAPDVLLHHRYARRPPLTRSFNLQSTSTTQPVSLPWDVICPDAIQIEEEEEIEEQQTPTERLVQHLCDVCKVPSANINTVMTMLTTQFGTVALDMTILDTLVERNSVILIGVLVFNSVDPTDQYIHHSSPSFIQFLKRIQDLYESTNPFHNSCHAADVLHSLFILLSTSPIRHRITLHRRIAALLAAVLHDVGHNGFTNQFLIQSKHAIALQYKDSEAPMEGMHADIAVNVLSNPSFGIFINMSSVEVQEMIEVVRTTIRSTALVYQKELINELNNATAANLWSTQNEELLSIPLQLLLLRGVLHVSDISQTMKPFAIHTKWVTRLNDEMFQQGDVDDRLQLSVSPAYCFRRNWTLQSFLSSQIWFLENFAVPAITALQGVNGIDVNTFVISLRENINEWRRQLAAIEPTKP